MVQYSKGDRMWGKYQSASQSAGKRGGGRTWWGRAATRRGGRKDKVAAKHSDALLPGGYKREGAIMGGNAMQAG